VEDVAREAPLGVELALLVLLGPLLGLERDLELGAHRVHAPVGHLAHVVQEEDEALEQDDCGW